MPRYDFVSTFWPWTHNSRHQHTILTNTLGCVCHSLIINHLERVISKLMQFSYWKLNYVFTSNSLTLFLSSEEVIKRNQAGIAFALCHS